MTAIGEGWATGMDRPVCYSGGAQGADAVFGQCAFKAGHIVKDFSFQGHRTNPAWRVELSQSMLDKADPYLVQANRVLGRRFPTANMFVNNLLRRNYYQVKDSDKVYAVATRTQDQKFVNGGTAWAVQMAIYLGKAVYLYDMNYRLWYAWSGNIMHKWMEVGSVFMMTGPSGAYAGIGSRNLTMDGANAIAKLFGQEPLYADV